MRATGITKKFDELGRVTIPKEYRDKYGFSKGEYAELFIDDTGVYLKKYQPGCTFCSAVGDVVEIGDKKLCKNCIAKIKNSVY